MKFWQSYSKNKTVQFFLPHSVHITHITAEGTHNILGFSKMHTNTQF